MKNATFSALSLLALTLQLATPTAGATGACSVSALDTVAGLGTQVSVNMCDAGLATIIEMRGPESAIYIQHITLDAGGSATTLIPSKNTIAAGRYEFTVAGKSGSFNVLADRADDAHSTLTVTPQIIAADGQSSATVTAVLRDRYDNAVSGRPLALIASRLTDEVEAQSKQTDDNGRFLWTVRSAERGTTSLVVYDIAGARQMKLRVNLSFGSKSSTLGASLTGFEQGGTSPQKAIAPSAWTAATTDITTTDTMIDHYEVALPQNATDVKANELFSLTIRAMRGTELIRGYIGTLVVKCSDTDADLPKKGTDPKNPKLGHVDMRGVDQGERNVPLAFVLRATGTQTIEFADQMDATITGKITLNVTGGDSGGTGKITILDPRDRSTIRSGPITLQGHAPSLVNLKVKGGSDVVMGETDSEGVFRINVPINPQDKEVTLFVTSENGTYESDPVHIIIDTDPPVISTITIDPAETKATDQAQLTVKSEPALGAVTASMNGQNFTLIEDPASPGQYQVALTAPAQEGTYDITVTAADPVGNTTTMLTKWTVKAKSMPIVQNVTAEAQAATIAVKWTAITAVPVINYKIYISTEDDPTNYLYGISTGKPVTSAVIKDLPLGKTYLFSLTAIGGENMESPEKSIPAKAAPLGLQITVIPGQDSLMLEWMPMPNLPLDHYVLQYGTEAGVYPEQRTVNGEAKATVLHDLLNGVTYEVKLTPVTVTGKPMPELAAIGHGTVGGTGFTAGPVDPVPTDILGHPGAPLHNPNPLPNPNLVDVPTNSGSGLSSMMLGFVGMIALVGGLLWRRMKMEQRKTRDFMLMMQQRYHL